MWSLTLSTFSIIPYCAYSNIQFLLSQNKPVETNTKQCKKKWNWQINNRRSKTDQFLKEKKKHREDKRIGAPLKKPTHHQQMLLISMASIL